MNKPANLIVEETKENIVKIINESGLPPFLLEPILKDLYNQVSILKQQELEKSRQEYENSLKQEEKKKGAKKDGQKVTDAYVTINEQNYTVHPAVYEGPTPFTAQNINKLQSNIEESIETYVYDLILTANVAAGGEITLPFYYKVGAGVLQVYYMGQLLLLSSDDAGTDGHYREVGTSGSLSNKIKLTTDWSADKGEYFKFVVKGVYENETE